jgi:3-oxoacyl-[acyl-carrier-protein] synthase II
MDQKNPAIYIKGTGCVSPQKTSDPVLFPAEIISGEVRQLKCQDPNYKEFIPADQIRRMGRVIRMGIAAASLCVKDAGSLLPDAIITGTGLGCIEDTEKFLATMIRNQEEFLTPTSFIQSTHNTVGAQIALQMKCHGYNFTYVHRGLSFESALLDSMMQIETGSAGMVLTGASDELTPNSFAIMDRMGHWKRKPVNNLNLLDDRTRGTIAGEGAAFFLLGSEKSKGTYAQLSGVGMVSAPASADEVAEGMDRFLAGHGIAPGDIDLLVTGLNGDPSSDAVYHQISGTRFSQSAAAVYKHLCGEYHTSSAFATWLAAGFLRAQNIPSVSLRSSPPRKLEQILIWNQYRGLDHSFILLSRA